MDEKQSRTHPFREHMRFQKVTWIVERIGWSVLAIVPLLGLAGLFGSGPLRARTVGNPSLSVKYERFERVTRMARFVVSTPTAPGGERHLRLNAAFQRHYRVDDIQPRPLRSSASPDGIDLDFSARDETLIVVIWATPQDFGAMSLQASGGDGAALPFPAFVYP